MASSKISLFLAKFFFYNFFLGLSAFQQHKYGYFATFCQKLCKNQAQKRHFFINYPDTIPTLSYTKYIYHYQTPKTYPKTQFQPINSIFYNNTIT